MVDRLPRKDEVLSDELRAYENKDYSEVIQFPVELVDRDGVVRRYSYEESLAVYHRRIQSAPWRLDDDQVVRAEIGHCSRRIDQIKRSFREQLGTGSVHRILDNPRAVLGEGYEILAAFYDKVLERRQLTLDGGLGLAVALLEDEVDCRLYHLSFGSHQGGHLLYVYPFEKPGDQDPRAAWRDATKRYRRYAGAQVERLLLAEQGDAAGYILTGSEEIPRGLRARLLKEGDPNEFVRILGSQEDQLLHRWQAGQLPGALSHSSWNEEFDRGMLALGKDQLSDALEHFERAVEQNPYHRESYLAVLGVLDTTGGYEEADLYAEMARAHLPADGLICYRIAILHVRQGRLDQALAAFDEAATLEPTLYQAPFFASHLMLARLQDLDGATVRLRLAAELSERNSQVVGCLRAAEACRMLRRGLRFLAILVAAPALWLVVTEGSLSAAILLTGALGSMLLAGKLATWVARWTVRRASLLIDDAEQ